MNKIIYIESGGLLTPYMDELRGIYKNTSNMFFTNNDIIKYCEHNTNGDKFISLRLPEQTVSKLSVSASTKIIHSVSGFTWDEWTQKPYTF